jgi:creatinine amidohydrolase
MDTKQKIVSKQRGSKVTMRWEELTGDQFGAAVEQSQGVCLMALSVIERHGHHLPVGTDMLVGHELLTRVAELEPALVFPDYIFTQIPEARHCVGTISIEPDLMLRLLDNVCREIARNGLKKIVLVNCHGGNNSFLPFFTEWQLSHPRDYVVYLVQPTSVLSQITGLPWAPETDGHAGPRETSMILTTRPDLVDMHQIPTIDEGKALNRLQALKEAGVRTGMWWYADYPTHYAGNAGSATAEAGELLFEKMAQHVARAVRAIKEDTETERLQNEFYIASQAPSVPSTS